MGRKNKEKFGTRELPDVCRSAESAESAESGGMEMEWCSVDAEVGK
jgi:hypothetical protein